MRAAAHALALCLAVATGASFAQPRPRPGTGRPPATTPAAQVVPPEGPTVHVEPANPWDTTDPDELVAHIQRAALGPGPAGARAIAGTLLSGVTPRVAANGLDALGAIGRPEGAEAVLRFLDHRRAALRRHAVAAAAGIHTRPLVRALEARLGDPDADVRAEAAQALGEHGVGDTRSIAPLWTAFERDLDATLRSEGSALAHNAAVSLARLGGPDDMVRLVTFLRRAPFATMADAFRAALDRADLPEPARLRLVTAVGDLATHEAREFLTAWAGTHRRPPSPVSNAALTAAGRIAE